MDKIKLKCRSWYKGVFPSTIKLEIPGWAGKQNKHKNGDQPQPWHCIPFVEASTYGLELVYSFDTECKVKNINGNIVFEGDFSEENKSCPEVKLPPFLSFSSGHFGMGSCLDIEVPDGYSLRTEPHPKFYTDSTGTVPCCIPGHIQTSWWPKIFFVVFKNPNLNQEIIFRKNEPYGQILIVPDKIQYEIEKMTSDEENTRNQLSYIIEKNISKIASNCWRDNKGNNFSDKYKQISKIYKKDGKTGVERFLKNFSKDSNDLSFKKEIKKIKKRLFLNETLQNKKK